MAEPAQFRRRTPELLQSQRAVDHHGSADAEAADQRLADASAAHHHIEIRRSLTAIPARKDFGRQGRRHSRKTMSDWLKACGECSRHLMNS